MTPVFIFDLDGTLSNPSHRLHCINRLDGAKPTVKDWDRWMALSKYDSPYSHVIFLLRLIIASGNKVWIYTGRREDVREDTIQWLCHHTGLPETYLRIDGHLRMRPVKNRINDDALKEKWYLELSNVDKRRIIGVFEDRDKVVAMWRRNGVPCFQVKGGDF